ncbi:hypothetical protein [Methanobrevibacter curvatus]|uniref:Uncharacterized protein n=1 Tax=Methanobrevibacter curvatus TaxID=49547 RepID=A0A162FDI1_9EURY|nr:hypothetical protein [Methanobrevibacter curvatus]KZX11435.1 hypothetical protein MBCUR_14310 [Methanobrevibacter curvatus]
MIILKNKNNLLGKVFLRIISLKNLKNLFDEFNVDLILFIGNNENNTINNNSSSNSSNSNNNIKLINSLLENDFKFNFNSSSISNVSSIENIVSGVLKKEINISIFNLNNNALENNVLNNIIKGLKFSAIILMDYKIKNNENFLIDEYFNVFEENMDLIENFNEGILIANADNPISAHIGKLKEADLIVNFYSVDTPDLTFSESNGLNCSNESNNPNISNSNEFKIKCPKCGENLQFFHKFSLINGVFKCTCGFRRPGANVKIIAIDLNKNPPMIHLKGNPYNYQINSYFSFDFELEIPFLRENLIYPSLLAITFYASFTKNPELLERNLNKVFSPNLQFNKFKL